ncbi:DMT family transporter [Clostridium sp. AL.422]|uniref:DMT family transporter n=1 Tax=Clostridium TaxID=1485 RepID=UPI00293DE4FE|nr:MULTISPECIES: DMT family transporter [unclassified Clostridium]MDV4150041.1 DMT family transporter [Clostridium sp. AL.422]
MFFIYILIAILAGVSVVLARIINSRIADEIGTFQGTFINYLTGSITAFIFFILSKEYVNLGTLNYSDIPIYSYLGGAISILVVLLSNYTTPKVSSFSLSLLVFIGQLAIGIFIDYYAYSTVSIGKIIGGILILIGLSYNMVIDKKNDSIPELISD